MDDCFKVTLTVRVVTFIRLLCPIVYNYVINIVGVKKCISLYGGYSWPDLLCGIKDGCEDVFKAGKFIVNI